MGLLMNNTEFDKFAEEYRSLHTANIAISGEKPDYFAEYKIRDLATDYFTWHGRDSARPAVLDFGAGIGTSVPFIKKYLPLADLTCLDVSTKSLELGQHRFSGHARFMHFDGMHIPFPDASFNIVFAACVFHHIDHSEHLSLLREFHRVLAPSGFAFIFEHNPYNPLTAHVVKACPFDANAHLISAGTMRNHIKEAGFSSPQIHYRIFFPHVLRALRPLESWMTWLPIGAQYYVVAKKR